MFEKQECVIRNEFKSPNPNAKPTNATHTPKQNKQTQTPNSRTSTYVFNIPPDRKMFKAIPNEVGPNVAPDAMIALVSPPSTPKI